MNTYHVYINGIVQGVGFRPFVYQLANTMQLNGYIKNGRNGLHIFFNAEEENANQFFKKIKEQAPKQATIISAFLEKTTSKIFENFSIIVEDNSDENKEALLSSDVALCENCRRELHDENNRRYRYPFITCTQCGPRYSIIKNIPYERINTSMEKFLMCDDCLKEYNDANNRRFFSQTNSCNECGIKLSLHNNTSTIISNNTEEILSRIKQFLIDGKIVAVKGIGGYLLLCDANNAGAINLLRNRKHRPAKPFAVLYSSVEMVKEQFSLNEREEALLLNPASPVVLLYPKHNAKQYLSIQNIAPDLNRVGVMISSNPLFDLIANDFKKPLIATSANISGSPIIYKDEDAIENLFEFADYVMSYNRDIIIPEDDSVIQVSKYFNQQIFLRRSKGYAPSFLNHQPKNNQCVLATGAFLKSSFTLSVNGNIFISHFLGSGESYEAQQMYKNTLQHLLNVYNAKPEIIMADKHPGYFSHQYAIELAEFFDAEIKFVQHHEAHFAAVLAENNLLQNDDAILGIIWDGTGFGNDGNIWGGEFFKYENNEMLRCYHFDYFPAIAGDKLALQPKLSALCTTNDVWHQSNIIKEKFNEAEWNNYQSLIQSTNLFSSSAGRIFDAVASLLSLCDKQTYEGEAAMYLQVLAEEYVDANGFEMNSSYFKEGSHYYRIPTATLMQGILIDIEKGKAKNYIAAKFHYSLVCLIDIVAEHLQIHKICFSGGVFQNALLVDWLNHQLKKKYQLFFHKNLSSNDENISFGQMVYHNNNMPQSLTGSLEDIDKKFQKTFLDKEKILENHSSFPFRG